MVGPVIYCGDPHSQFRHIITAAGHTKASAVVLLGDMQPVRPLHIELAPVVERGVPIFWIPGNHDADSPELYERVWGSQLAGCNIHGTVVTLPDGTRLAGLGGVFRESVWHPDPAARRAGIPRFHSRAEHARSTPRQERWQGGHNVKHWGSIYPHEYEHLKSLRADILVTHEAGGYHRYGFFAIDELARSLGVKVALHGHQHDRIDSSSRWAEQGFKSFGCGLRGVTAIDVEGNANVIIPGELDDARAHRERHLNNAEDAE